MAQPQITFESLMGEPPRDPELQDAPIKEPLTGPSPTSFEDLMGEEVAPSAQSSVEANEEYWDPKYYTDKAKLGMASLLSMGGLPLDFVHSMQYMALDMFDNLDQSFNDMIGRERTINGKPVPPEAFKAVKPALPFGFDAQVKAYEKILMGDFDFAEREKDMGLGKRTLGTIAEFAGGSAIPSASIISKTQGLIPKLVIAGTEVSSVVGGAIGAEGGGLIGEEISPEATSYARLVGTVLGSMSPYGFQAALRPAVTKIRGYLDPEFQARVGKEQAVKLIKKELADIPATLDELKRSERLRENIPGFSPHLGMETGNPGIMALQKRFAQKNTEGLAKAIEAETKSLLAIQSKMDDLFPTAERALTPLPEGRLQRIADSLGDDIAKIDAEVHKIESTINKGNPKFIGQRLRELREQKEIAARAIKNTKYEDFYRAADDANITVNPETIRNIAKETLDDPGLTFQTKASVLKDVEARYVSKTPDTGVTPFVDARGKPLPVPEMDIPMREFHSLYKRVNREMGVAYQGMLRGDNNAAAQYHQLSKMKKLFAEQLDVLKQGDFGVVADKLKDADDFFLNKYQKVFREGIGGEFDAMTRYGEKTPDSKIVEKIVMRDERGPQQFRELYGESLEAQQLMDNGVMDVFARQVMKDGAYDAKAAASFFKKHDVVLNEMPELKSILQNRHEAVKALTNRKAVLNERIKSTHRSRLQAMAGLNNTEEVVELAIKDPERMRSLRRTVEESGDPAAMLTLRHNVADNVMKQKDPFEYFLQHEDQMKLAFRGSKQHFDDLKELAEARRIMGRQFGVKQVGVDLEAKDAFKEVTGTSSVEAFSRLRWLNSGFLSPQYILSEAGSKFVLRTKQREMNRIMQEALYDKGVARKLLEYIDDTGALKPETTIPYRPASPKVTAAGQPSVAAEASKLGPAAEKEWAKTFKNMLFQIGVRGTIDATSKAELVED